MITSSLRWSEEQPRVGVQLVRGLKRSDYSSLRRKGSDAYRSSSKNPKQSERKSSSCDGLQMAGTHFEKLCASGGISAHLTQYARSKNIGLNSPMSPFLNWSLCLTSVEERLAPRSRVCACLDLLWRCSLSRKLRRATGLTRCDGHSE